MRQNGLCPIEDCLTIGAVLIVVNMSGRVEKVFVRF
jgi:hypothetical protein